MNIEIEKHLREEVDTNLGYLGGVEASSDEYKARVDNTVKLLDRVIEMEKLAREHDDRVAAQEAERALKEKQVEAELEFKREQLRAENELRRQQMEEDRKDRKSKKWLTVIEIGAPILAVIWGTVYTTNFEREGSYTTNVGRKNSGMFVGKLFGRR